MQYLGLALYAEGPTDYYFLRPLLQRLCENLCAREAAGPVEVSEVLGIDHPADVAAEPREQRILEAAKQARGAWRVLFVHADGANDPVRAHQEQVAPGLVLLSQQFAQDGIGVAVVPMRETEAWTLVDGDALRTAFGSSLADDALGVLAPRAAETSTDPKAVLQTAFLATQPTGRRRKQGPAPYLQTLGEEVSLARLRQVPAFAALERDVKAALRELRILR